MLLSPVFHLWRYFFPRKPARRYYNANRTDPRTERLTQFHASQKRQETALAIELSAQRRAIIRLLGETQPYSEARFQQIVAEEVTKIYAEQERPYATHYLPAITQQGYYHRHH